MKPLLLLLSALTVLSTRLPAEPMFGATPEWLAHESALTFTGVPQHVEIIPLKGWSMTRVRFKIEKCIKGPLSAGDVITVTSLEWEGREEEKKFRDAVENQRRVLALASIAKDSDHLIGGSYTFPLESLWRNVFFADEPVEKIYDAGGEAVRDFNEVLQRVEAQVRKEKELVGRPGFGMIREKEVEAFIRSSDAGKELYGGSILLKTLEYSDPAAEAAASSFPKEKRISVSLATADRALAHFGMVTLPALEVESKRKEQGSSLLTFIRENTVFTRCHAVSPDDRNRAEAAGVRWPQQVDIVVAGSVEKVEHSAWSFWSIRYSAGTGRALQAYIDAKTGEPLLVFIIRGN